MRVQHNIAAMNSYRNYNNNTKSINKNLEKLSSGYKINRAGDDAAGLAISEKMRAQITGLEGAQKNAKDGISLVQTAEGALTEVHSMLNRMYSLAEQSANGTYDSSVDRKQLQKEVDSLRTEINRVADSANFNGIKLLDGSLSGSGSVTSSSAAVSAEDVLNINTHVIKATKDERELTTVDPIASTKWETGRSAVLHMGLSDGRTLDLTLTAEVDDDGNTKLVGDNGKTYGNVAASSGAAANMDAADINKAFAARLKDTELYDTYKIDGTTDSSKITLTARVAGEAGTTITSAYMSNADTNSDHAVFATAGEVGGDQALTKITAGTNDITLFKVSDLKVFTGNNADDAVFTINGQKFAIADTEANAKKLDSDVHAIIATPTTGFVGDGTAAMDNNTIVSAKSAWTNAENDMKALAAEISRYTGLKATFDAGGDKIDGGENASASDKMTHNIIKLEANTSTSTSSSGKGLKLQIGDTADSWNQMNVSIDDIHTSALKIDSINIESAEKAAAAMAKIKDAINSVSDVRGGLGAIQNRLEHTINNLSVMQENIQDAESTIRDTDVADEMMKYTKNSILVQSAQAMLAQANQQPQGVLQLLQ